MAGGSTTFNIGIKTTADMTGINQIKQQLQQIQQLAGNSNFTKGKAVSDINQMVSSAKALNIALDSAFNKDLGVVNIQRFNQALQATGLDIAKIQTGLAQAGAVGQQAFVNTTAQLLKMSTTMKQAHSFSQKFANTFLNTARWMVTSSILNNIMGSFQKIWGYVKDLDTSLNNIQIVTDKSAEDMERFAKSANKAAQTLGSTTTDYTDASLIYYQQGLDDEAVKGRTDTTIKMANVMGSTAQEVSNYMTAIWNNFDNGSKSLEYYADVITNLGAHTASSAEEIADGLEKFAAVSNTVGLSYEYATTALATVVAQTRQSADIVGTAFKTLFARIESLKLGDTLDDGTTLGQYSQALEKVGINIKDQTGNLKDMDNILNEMGAKWQSLSKDQQVALAQSVAGVRQYTQLIALMDNWDTFQDNLEIAGASTGRLQKEQETYMDSIQAHLKTLKASSEDLYDSVLGRGQANKVIDLGSTVISIIAKMVDGMGNLPGILTLVGSLMLKSFSGQIAQSMLTSVQNMELMHNQLTYTKTQMQELIGIAPHLREALDAGMAGVSTEGMNAATQQLVSYYAQMAPLQEYMTKEQKASYNTTLDLLASASKYSIELDGLKDKWTSVSNTIEEAMMRSFNSGGQNNTGLFEKVLGGANFVNKSNILEQGINELLDKAQMLKEAGQDGQTMIDTLGTSISNLGSKFKKEKLSVKGFNTILNEVTSISKEGEFSIDTFIRKLQELSKGNAQLRETKLNAEMAKQQIEQLASSSEMMNVMFQAAAQRSVQFISSLSMMGTMLTSVSSLFKTITNDQLSFKEKLIQSITSISMIVPMFISSMSQIAKASKTLGRDVSLIFERLMGVDNSAYYKKESIALQILTNNRQIDNLVKQQAIIEDEALREEINKKVKSLMAENQMLASSVGIKEFNNTATKEEIIQSEILQGEKKKEVVLSWEVIAGKIKETWAKIQNNTVTAISIVLNNKLAMTTMILVGAIIALTIAYKTWVKRQQEAVEQSEKLAESWKELREAKEEELETIQKLISEYQDLYNSYKDGTISAEELKNKTYQLCMQYGEEELAVKSLTADYEELLSIMSEVERKKSGESKNLAEREVDNYRNAIAGKQTTSNTERKGKKWEYVSDFILDATTMGNYGGTLDNVVNSKNGLKYSTGAMTSKDEAAFYNELMSAIGKYSVITAGDGIQGGQVDFSGYEDEIVQNWDKIQSILSKYQQDIGNNTIYKNFSDYFSNISEDVDGLKDALAAHTEAIQGQIQAEYNKDIDDLSSVQEYDKKVQEIVDRLIAEGAYTNDDAGKEAAKAWVEGWISSFDDNLIYAQQSSVANALIDKWKDYGKLSGKYIVDEDTAAATVEDVYNEIQNWTESEKNYLYAHFDTIGALSDLETFRKDYKQAIEYFENQTVSLKIKTVVSDLEDGERIDTSGTSNLYMDQSFNASATMSAGDFMSADVSTQSAALLEMFQLSQEQMLENKKETYDNLDKELEAYKKHYDSILAIEQDYSDKYVAMYQERLTLAGEQGASYSKEEAEVDAQISTYEGFIDVVSELANGEKEWTEYSKEMQAVLEGMEISSKEGAKSKLAELEASKKAKAGEQDLEKQLEDVTNATYDTATAQLLLEKAHKNLNSVIDTIQSSYKTLTDAVTEYNSTGSMSMDQLQSLLDMDSTYLAALEWQDGQLKINAQTYHDLTEAQLDNAEAIAYQDAFIEMQTLAQQAQTEASINAANAEIDYANNAAACAAVITNTLIPAIQDGTYNAALFAAELSKTGLDISGVNQADIDRVSDALETKLKLIENMRNKISTPSGLNKALNPSKSSGSNKNDKKKDKKFEDEFDRYWEFNKLIEQTEKALSKLQERQNHVFGDELIKNLEAQNAELAKQKANYEALAAAQEVEARELRNSLSAFGASFSDTGELQNYAKLTNKVFSSYMNGSISEEQYEAFKKSLERYDTLFYSEMVDTAEKTAKAMQQMLDNNLKAFETEIEVHLNLESAKREWNQFLRDIPTIEIGGMQVGSFTKKNKDLGKDSDLITKSAYTYTKQNGTIGTDLEAMRIVQEEIDKLNNGGESTMFASVSEAEKKLEELKKQYMTDMKDLYKLWEESYNNYLEGIDQSAEKLEEINKAYDKIGDKLEHIGNLSKLLYGENDFDNQLANLGATKENQLGQLDSFRRQVELWDEKYREAVAAGDEKAAEKYKELREDAMAKLYKKEEEYIQTVLDEYATKVKKTFKDLEKQLTGGQSLNFISDQWDLTKERDNDYYDSVERVYQLESLERKYQKAINNAGSLKAQQKLKEVMDDQVGNLEAKTELTKYDVELAEKRLAVAEAEAALEDARNNKNSMKLARGTDGNWSYQYVADEDDVNDKTQQYLDASNDAYEFAKKSWEDIQERIVQVTEESLQKIQELELAKASATEEEKIKLEEQIQWYKNYYTEEIKRLTNTSQQYERELKTETAALTLATYNADVTNYGIMTTEQKGLIDSLEEHNITSLGKVYTTHGTTYDLMQQKAEQVLMTDDNSISALWNSAAANMIRTWVEDENSVKNMFEGAIKDCTIAQEELDKAVKEGCSAAGEDFTNLKGQINDCRTETQGLKGDTESTCATIRTELQSLYSYFIEVTNYWNNIQGAELRAGQELLNSVVPAVSTATGAYYGLAQAAATAAAAAALGASTPSSPGDNNGGPECYNIMRNRDGSKYNIYDDSGKLRGTTSDYDTAKSFVRKLANKEGKTTHYKTGGYTGTWNNGSDEQNGRLAFLHQKELVLNADDTQNMLSAVSAVRDIASLDTSISNAIANSVAEMLLKIANTNMGSGYNINNASSSNSENIFNITAEFPHANDVTEIREAILSLPNLASQYIGRR